MRNSSRKWLMSIFLAFSLTTAACVGSDATEETVVTIPSSTTEAPAPTEPIADVLKVAFVHTGLVADRGWSWAHDQGARYVETELGDAVEITTLESIPEGPGSLAVFEQLASEGNELIFGTSSGYEEAMIAAARIYPDVAFIHAAGSRTSEIVGSYFGAAEEGHYLTGMAAGAATETNVIGFVAGFPIPEVLRGVNAFTLGARELNPEVEIHVVWTAASFDPPVEGEAARGLFDVGADVIAMHQYSAAAGLVADTKGAKWVGYNSDMTEIAPDAWLTAAIWNWGPYYLSMAQDVIDGIWAAGVFYGNMAGGMVDIAPLGSSVSVETAALIATRQRDIIDGAFSVFSDPLTDQDGLVRELGDVFGMDFFVEGVVGSASG